MKSVTLISRTPKPYGHYICTVEIYDPEEGSYQDFSAMTTRVDLVNDVLDDDVDVCEGATKELIDIVLRSHNIDNQPYQYIFWSHL